MDIHSDRVANPKLRRALVVDDHPLYCDALASALEISFQGSDTRKASTLREAIETLRNGYDPDLILFDLKLPDVKGISGFHQLRDVVPDKKVLVISSLATTEVVYSLMDAGARGFLPKDAPSEQVTHAISEVLAGRLFVPAQFRRETVPTDEPTCEFDAIPEIPKLTAQQSRILKLICEGKANKAIAHELSLAEATVKAHITALLRRLGVHSRLQAVVLVEQGRMSQSGDDPEARVFLGK